MKSNYNRRKFIRYASVAGLGLGIAETAAAMHTKKESIQPLLFPGFTAAEGKRVGIIGLDTSHSTAFVQVLNQASPDPDYAGYRVVAAYPKGSKDIQSSVERVPAYTEEVKKAGVEIVDSIETLLTKVDVILLETNDGRPHLEQALPVMKAGKKLFIDKPVAGTLRDAIAVYEAAKKYKVPVFSSSSLRYTPGAQNIAQGKTVGKVLSADAYSPCPLEKTHPDLFWYGIHGVETLFTVMGKGCKQVSRIHTDDTDFVTGVWEDNRIGTFRGIRKGKSDYGGTAFGETGIAAIGSYAGYEPLLKQIIQFFQTGTAPVAPEETLEIYAFMEAADESKRKGGEPVSLAAVMQAASAKTLLK